MPQYEYIKHRGSRKMAINGWAKCTVCERIIAKTANGKLAQHKRVTGEWVGYNGRTYYTSSKCTGSGQQAVIE